MTRSAAESEVGGLSMNELELSPMKTTLELNHPQPATLLKTDNSTADSIMNKTIKQRQRQSNGQDILLVTRQS